MRSVALALLTSAAVAALPAGAAAQGGSPDLPVIAIDAPNGIVDEPKSDATMRVYDGYRREVLRSRIGIELRGFTSQEDDPKKPYSIETRKADGSNRNVPLLGMPSDDDWVLIAGARDESLLRNYMVYATARRLGRYAPRSLLVEVVLNDSYEGVYLLAEDLKLHEDRVAVDDSKVSGGYLLEMMSARRTEGEEFFTTPVKGLPVAYKDPNGEDLPVRRAEWIRNYVNRLENALYSERFRNRRRGYRRYLDMDAAVDYMLLNELFRNADTFRNSTYMHKSAGEKLVLGPVWDFDHAAGNDGDAEDNATSGWEYAASPWAERLYADPAFAERMATRWKELRRRDLKVRILRTINRGARQLRAGASERNFSRWPVFAKNEAQPNDPRTGAPPAHHAQAVDYLRWWTEQRFKWISRNVKTLGTPVSPPPSG